MFDLSKTLRSVAVLTGLVGTSTAYAMPWDLDMVDSDAVKAYEREMAGLPDGVKSQPNVLTPNPWHENWKRETPEGQALTNPFDAADADLLATGEKMYATYCAPCHGADGVNLGPVAQPGRFPAVVALGGDAGVLKGRTDGHVYLTIRNGGAIMPRYGWAMTDREMWSIVAWMRSNLPNSAAPAPKGDAQ